MGAFEEGYDPVPGDIRAHFVEAERMQTVGNNPGRPFLAVGQLGVHVKIAAGFDEGRSNDSGGAGNLFCSI